MKKYRNIAIAFVVLMTAIIIFACTYYKYNLGSVSKKSEEVTIVIEEGSISSIANTLKENKVIKDVNIFKLYLKLHKINNLKASTYTLNKNMDVPEIVKILSKGNSYNNEEVKITFKEGINMRKVIKLITENTSNTEEDILNTLQDETYLKSIIEKYWFLTDEILNKKLYYSLEGYLFPDTYIYLNKDVTVSDIFNKMLDNMDKKLSPYKDDINKTGLNIHELITLASMIELEGAGSDDRKGVAGVFYNRLNADWSLGSDVTTYYAFKVDLGDRLLTKKEYDACNSYNTRCKNYIGLPVGPISNPSLDSIEACVYPTKHNYYYFVADCNKKTYFHKTNSENLAKKQQLINQDNWCE